MTNRYVVSRRRLLEGAVIGTGMTVVSGAGALMLEETAVVGIETTVPTSAEVTVSAAPGVSTRLAFSASLNRGVAARAGTTLLNRTSGSSFTTTIAGIAIDNASGAVTGTPTALSGLVTEHLADGTSKDNFLYLPKATQRKMRIGQGIGGYAFYTKNLIWLDYLKAGEWSTLPATQDANGMPLTLASNRALYVAPIDNGSVTPIKYRIITDGNFDLEGWARQGSDLVRTWTGSEPGVSLVFTAIRKAATYMHLVRDDEAALFRSGEIFKPEFLAEMSKHGWLRWMNVHGGNIDKPIPDKPAALSYSRVSVPGGLPLSVIAAFHKKTRIGLWLNIHIDTTPADFDADIKPVLLDLIASGIEVYCEYSNEVWNESFGQHYKAIAKANAAGYPGGYSYASSWWVGRVTAQLAMACRGTGVRWLIGTQFGMEHILSDALLEGMNTVSGRADSDIFAYIPSGYASGSLTRYDPGGVQKTLQDQWVATGNFDAAFDNLLNYTGPVAGDRSYSAEANRPALRTAKALADSHGWKLMVYEGNAHLNANGAPSERFLFAMSRNALMAPAIEALQEVHEEEGVYGYTHFDFGWGPDSSNSNAGVFELYGLPGYAGIERYRDTSDNSGGLRS